ncbi:hypothetical protein L1887_58103 [Cichorium endivia]|nr:hypothetical protein L1887_58103 [Cichorium endivia]
MLISRILATRGQGGSCSAGPSTTLHSEDERLIWTLLQLSEHLQTMRDAHTEEEGATARGSRCVPVVPKRLHRRYLPLRRRPSRSCTRSLQLLYPCTQGMAIAPRPSRHFCLRQASLGRRCIAFPRSCTWDEPRRANTSPPQTAVEHPIGACPSPTPLRPAHLKDVPAPHPAGSTVERFGQGSRPLDACLLLVASRLPWRLRIAATSTPDAKSASKTLGSEPRPKPPCMRLICHTRIPGSLRQHPRRYTALFLTPS